MNDRRVLREGLKLTQAAAAAQAGVSFATWRRWEDDPETVGAKTREACERVLDREGAFRSERAAYWAKFEQAWSDSAYITPRQAAAIASALDWWSDVEVGQWLEGSSSEHLHEISPFSQLDLRVMMLVNENKAWVAKARERCVAVSDEIEAGVLPFDRPGCYFDELLMALALRSAEDSLTDMPELYEGIPPRGASGDDEEDGVSDEDWDGLSDSFDDRCRWDEWEVPLGGDHPLLRAILDERHPFTWFDNVPATGPGYLNRLAGIEIRVQDQGE